MSTFRRLVSCVTVGVLTASPFAIAAVNADPGLQSLDSIRVAAREYVKRHVPSKERDSIQITVGTLDSRLRLATCTGPLAVSLPANATFRGRMTVAVSCPGTPTWKIYVAVGIETTTSVLVLKHASPRGALLTAQDVEVQTRIVSGSSEAYLTDVTQLSGRILKRPLGVGATLTVDVMAADALIKRGQQVTLLAAAGGMEVRAQGVAMSDAPAAGRVKAQNLSSGRMVEGVAESANVIRITP